MELLQESMRFEDYLEETDIIDFSHPLIMETTFSLFKNNMTEIEKIRVAYEFVRDAISHSWDSQSKRVTCHASEVLMYKKGICYAKSHILAALLRSQGIPTGFCYQRLMLFDTPEKGFCIHALNAVFLNDYNKWIRLDARGNKEGIDAQFSINEENLAFNTQEECDEKDYPIIYTEPHPKTVQTLKNHSDAIEMYKYFLPEFI